MLNDATSALLAQSLLLENWDNPVAELCQNDPPSYRPFAHFPNLPFVSFRFIYFRIGRINRTLLYLMERPRSLRLASNPINKIY